MPHAGHTSSNADIEILAIDNATWIPLMLAQEYDADGNPKPKTMVDSQTPQGAEQSTYRRLEILTQEDWFGGVGKDYDVAEAVYTRTPGYALPAGAVTAVSIPAGGAANTPIVAFAEYGSDLFAAEEGDAGTGGRVLRLPGGTGAAWLSTGGTDLILAAGRIIRDLLVFDDGAGNQRLYASSTNTSGLAGDLHRWDGSAWTTSSSTFGANPFGAANGRNRMARVQWTIDGVSAWRMVTISRPNTIAYTKPNADPFDPASWVEGVKIVTDTYLDELAAARKHVWVGSKSDVHDFDEQGNSPGLMGYENRAPTGVRFPLQYFDGYVYRAAGSTLDRIYVDNPTLQSNPGQCAPGFGTEAQNDWRGYPTALCIDQGYIVASIWNPTTGRSGIFWGKDRQIAGVETANPLVWYGPEVVSAGTRRVTAMKPSMLAGDRRLWIGSLTGLAPEIVWASLPVAGAPLQDLLSSGTHRFAVGGGSGNWNANCRLQLMRTGFRDRVDYKILHQHGLATRGLGGGTSMLLETRADATPAQTTWTTSDAITTSPEQDITPAVVTAGWIIDRRISITSASSTTPGVLDAIRTTAWEAVPAFGVRPITVTYGDGVTDNYGAPLAADIEPHDITVQLDSLTRGRKTQLRDRNGRRWTVKLEQVMDRVETLGDGPYGATVVCKLEVSFMEQLD